MGRGRREEDNFRVAKVTYFENEKVINIFLSVDIFFFLKDKDSTCLP